MQRSKSRAAAAESDGDHRIAIAVGDHLNPCGIGLDKCVGALLFASQERSPPYPPQNDVDDDDDDETLREGGRPASTTVLDGGLIG